MKKIVSAVLVYHAACVLLSRTALMLMIMMTMTACTPGGKKEDPGGQAGPVSSAEGISAEGVSAEGISEEASGSLQDGSYVPTLVRTEGGTGKVTITCPEVLLEHGQAQARIVFSSPHYAWVKVDGTQYDPENTGEKERKNSVFSIPVVLDEEMKISGLTTAMSEPHEIEYTLLISLTQKEERKDPAQEDPVQEDPAQEDPAQEDPARVQKEGAGAGEDDSAGADRSAGTRKSSEPPVLEGLTLVSAMDIAYAETFAVYSYKPTEGSEKGGNRVDHNTEGEPEVGDTEGDRVGNTEDLYRLIDVYDSGQYLLVPEAGDAAEASAQKDLVSRLPGRIRILRAPLDNLYVAATSSMALFDAAGAIGQVRLTGTRADGWYIDAPKKALADGSMVYAGKYSAPDYELLADSGCDLAVESMMILHAPEVRDKLEELGIPVFIDTSSNENHPLGRTEWVRLYGVLTGHEREAEAFFEKQKEAFSQVETPKDTGKTDTGKTVAFFSISSGGNVIVRAADDYIPRMIRLAGASYSFEDLLSESGNSASVRLSMEDFYNTARDADFLIYNATIENPVKSVDELCGLSALLYDFKAVQEGNVWQVQKSLYQSPDIAAEMITDLRRMLTDTDTGKMTFLNRLK